VRCSLLLLSVSIAVAAFASSVPAEATAPQCFGRSATIEGTAAADDLTGTSGNDVIVGGAGRDNISGRGGNDLICAGEDSDFGPNGTRALDVAG
jgi:Ca2+-binding RTX toxin-like protein